jgi:hypothetical protein
MMHILLLGAGGAGLSGGAPGAAGASLGGAGGCSGVSFSALIPLALVPGVLYVYISKGGVSAPSNISAHASLVAFTPINTPTNASQILAYADCGPNGNGTTPLASTFANVNTAGICVFQSLGGVTSGSSLLAQSGYVVTAGRSGAALPASGNGANGLGFNGTSVFSLPGDLDPPSTSKVYVAGGLGTAGDGGNGQDGISYFNGYFMHIGGGSGASTGTVAGSWKAGNGGKGGLGCGGGGGGGCLTGGTRSVGGDGGDGICIITCW